MITEAFPLLTLAQNEDYRKIYEEFNAKLEHLEGTWKHNFAQYRTFDNGIYLPLNLV
jgi:hypothetical protein